MHTRARAYLQNFGNASSPERYIFNFTTMAKRTVTELQPASDGQPFPKVNSNGPRRPNDIENPEMGEFEDAWEDEIESDEEVVDSNQDGNAEEGGLLY